MTRCQAPPHRSLAFFLFADGYDNPNNILCVAIVSLTYEIIHLVSIKTYARFRVTFRKFLP